jgi:hypothetical protein
LYSNEVDLIYDGIIGMADDQSYNKRLIKNVKKDFSKQFQLLFHKVNGQKQKLFQNYSSSGCVSSGPGMKSTLALH